MSGLVTFTVYTRGFAPRHWVCGIIEQQSGGFGNNTQLALLNPLGPGSDADVLVSQLAIQPVAQQSGWEAVMLRGVFDGVHGFEAVLNTRRRVGDDGHASIGNTWNAAFRGRDGAIHVLSIEFKVSWWHSNAATAHRQPSPVTLTLHRSLITAASSCMLCCAVLCLSVQPGQLQLPFNGSAM